MDRLAPSRSATRPAAWQRPLRDARMHGGEISFWTSLHIIRSPRRTLLTPSGHRPDRQKKRSRWNHEARACGPDYILRRPWSRCGKTSTMARWMTVLNGCFADRKFFSEVGYLLPHTG